MQEGEGGWGGLGGRLDMQVSAVSSLLLGQRWRCNARSESTPVAPALAVRPVTSVCLDNLRAERKTLKGPEVRLSALAVYRKLKTSGFLGDGCRR